MKKNRHKRGGEGGKSRLYPSEDSHTLQGRVFLTLENLPTGRKGINTWAGLAVGFSTLYTTPVEQPRRRHHPHLFLYVQLYVCTCVGLLAGHIRLVFCLRNLHRTQIVQKGGHTFFILPLAPPPPPTLARPTAL